MLGPEGALSAQKVFSRRDVIVALAPHLYGRAPAELGRAVSAVLRDPDAVALVGAPRASERAYATASVLATETAIERAVARGLSTASGGQGRPRCGRGRHRPPGVWPRGRPHRRTARRRGGHHDLWPPGRAGLRRGRFGQDHGHGGRAGRLQRRRVQRRGHVDVGPGGAYVGPGGRHLLVPDARLAALAGRPRPAQPAPSTTWWCSTRPGMASDQDVPFLVGQALLAGAKVVMVGDDRQLGCRRSRRGVGGARRAPRRRRPRSLRERPHPGRGRAPGPGRAALGRRGPGAAVLRGLRPECSAPLPGARRWPRWSRAGRPTWPLGKDTAMFAWRRANVAELNRLARDPRWRRPNACPGPS